MGQFRLAIMFMFLNSVNSIFEGYVYTSKNQSSIVTRVLDHYVLENGEGVRVSDVTRGGREF